MTIDALEQRDASQPYGELFIDSTGEAHFICHTQNTDFSAAKIAVQKFIALLESKIDRESECPYHTSEGSQPPRRYCVRDKVEIDPKRVMRGSSFCSNECRKEDLKERRDYRASKACRLCGRPAKHRKKPQIVSSAVCDGGTAQETPLQERV